MGLLWFTLGVALGLLGMKLLWKQKIVSIKAEKYVYKSDFIFDQNQVDREIRNELATELGVRILQHAKIEQTVRPASDDVAIRATAFVVTKGGTAWF